MRTAAVAVLIVALVLGGVVTGCNRTPTRPSFLSPPAPTPSPTPVPPAVGRIELTGPRTVAPGATAQFTVIGHQTDGSTIDLTSQSFFRSNRTSVLSVSATGLATGVTRGDAFLTVSVSGRNTSREVIVVPDGTYRLVGAIAEADSPTTPVADVRVEAIGGDNPATTTGSDGRYRLYGVPSGAVQIRITRDGYQLNVQTVMVTDHHVQNFVLAVSAPRADLAGTYTLNISASPTCQSMLNEAARSRSYTVVVTQQGPKLEGKLSGATFAVQANRGDRILGRVEPFRVIFSFSSLDPYYYYYEYPEIVEQITPSLYLTVMGSGVSALTGSRFSGSLNGSFTTYAQNPSTAFSRPTAVCRASDHQFELTR